MYAERQGSLFDAGAEALVSPVNCIGVSGKGLAAVFKKRFPAEEAKFVEWCAQQARSVGDILVVRRDGNHTEKVIIYVPTKQHWRNSSNFESVSRAITNLASTIMRERLQRVAVPALGCGLGGLRWTQVRPLMEAAFSPITAEVLVYQPNEENPR